MFTNPNPPAFDTSRLDAYAALLSAGYILSRAVLALQFAETMPEFPDLHEQAITELYAANDLYVDAYAEVNPK